MSTILSVQAILERKQSSHAIWKQKYRSWEKAIASRTGGMEMQFFIED